MIDGRRVTAIIAGRGGSKGLPGKNLADVGGRPMIAWSVAAALGSGFVDDVVTSSDDSRILDAAEGAGCRKLVKRPAELATDQASIHDAVLHALDATGRDRGYVVLLQATSPLRRADDIDACLGACHAASAPSAVTVTPMAKPLHWMFRIRGDGTLSAVASDASPTRRQDAEQVFALNGAVYVADIDWYRRHRTFLGEATVTVVMPPERSVDVDSAFDLSVVRVLVRQEMEKTDA